MMMFDLGDLIGILIGMVIIVAGVMIAARLSNRALKETIMQEIEYQRKKATQPSE